MPIPVLNDLNKGIASCVKIKIAFFQKFLFILKQTWQKKVKPKIWATPGQLFVSSNALKALTVLGGLVSCRRSTPVTLEENHTFSKQIEWNYSES